MKGEDAVMASFQIIGYSGEALDYFQKAIDAAKEYKFTEARELMKTGKESVNEAHKVQTQMLTQQANGEEVEVSVILVHSQDHLMTTLTYQRMANEYIELYERLYKIENKI